MLPRFEKIHLRKNHSGKRRITPLVPSADEHPRAALENASEGFSHRDEPICEFNRAPGEIQSPLVVFRKQRFTTTH
jgi:hypothetical protein